MASISVESEYRKFESGLLSTEAKSRLSPTEKSTKKDVLNSTSVKDEQDEPQIYQPRNYPDDSASESQ